MTDAWPLRCHICGRFVAYDDAWVTGDNERVTCERCVTA